MIMTICIALTVCYVALMLLYRVGWAQQSSETVPNGFSPRTHVSVIIPARNEMGNIDKCVPAVLNQRYPQHLLEVIVVDDHSEDGTGNICHLFPLATNLRCIQLADYIQKGTVVNSYKKKAIEAGISTSAGELIITTDADCIAGKDWLRNMVYAYEKEQAAMVVAPVDFTCNGSTVQQFQSLDFMSMQGITVASHKLRMGNMCNGANLAFSHSAFESVGGYTGVDHLASGDDYLLMMKLNKAYPGRIAYVKAQEAIVRTAPQPDWGSFLQQRIRWASKSGKYDDKKMTTILAFVYLYNLSFVVALFAGLWKLAVGMLAVKIMAEIFYLYPVASFFNKRNQLILFPFLQPLHILYIIIAGLLGFVGVYRWKGRSVR